MKSKLALLAFAIAIVSCNVDKKITIENPSNIDVVQKSVEIDRGVLEGLLGKLPEKNTAFLVGKDNASFPVQFDDLDHDGKWDVLFTQVDLDAHSKNAFSLDFDSNEEIQVKTNIRLADKGTPPQESTTADRLKTNDSPSSQAAFQMEGPGWENDVVGFRNYFDARNGIDIYGKRTEKMALDECGLDGGPSYHELQWWGMDVLKVGNSLGAGAIALKTKSGLHRVGPDCKGTFEIVKEGPIRSIFDLKFVGMKVDDQVANITHRIIIEAGAPYYKSQVWVEGVADAELVTGIVNLHSYEFWSKGDSDVSYFYTHDNQAFDGEKLGMAVIVETNNMVVETTPEEGEGITQTFYTALPIEKQPVEFYFMVGWEKQDEIYSTKAGFEKEIQVQSKQIAAKLKF